MISRRFLSVALNTAICAGTAALVGCNQQPASPQAGAPIGAASAPIAAASVAQAPAYVPPTADQLYQLVAPIALFPDKLVAQVLAGSTYPDQVTAADSFLEQNQSLQGSALQDAVNPQAWDPSIKGLTVFPKVLDQMAQNIPWTTALGTAYANDPTDVLNAIQVMRQRASKHGTLRSSAQLRVVDQPVTSAADDTYASAPPDDSYQPAYYGSGVVPAPQQTIEIEPADADTVYVPEYDPQTVYGEEIESYPSYRYEPSGYSTGQMVATGALAFGAGIVVASLLEHSHHQDRPNYGWNSWGMQWHGNDRGPGGNDGDRDRWRRPAVVHNDTVYVSRSTTINRTVINRTVINRNDNSVHINGNRNVVGVPGQPAQGAAATRPPMPNAPGNRFAGPSHAPAAAPQPISRPNFNGALTKGQPPRFAHPGAPNDAHGGARPGVAPVPTPVPAGHPPAVAHQAHVSMPDMTPPRARTPMPHAADAGQPHTPPGRMGSMRTPGQRVDVAPSSRPATPAHTPAPVFHPPPHPAAPQPVATHPMPAHLAPSRPAPTMQRPPAITRQPPPVEHHDAPRPAPMQRAPMPAPEHHEAPRPAPVQHQAPPPRPQQPAHNNPQPQKDGHPKKDDKQH